MDDAFFVCSLEVSDKCKIDLANRYRIEVKRYSLADWRATRIWYAEG